MTSREPFPLRTHLKTFSISELKALWGAGTELQDPGLRWWGHLVGIRPISLPEASYVWAWVFWISDLGHITAAKDIP